MSDYRRKSLRNRAELDAFSRSYTNLSVDAQPDSPESPKSIKSESASSGRKSSFTSTRSLGEATSEVYLPPRRVAGYLWKRSPHFLRAHQLRYVSIDDGRLSWWSSAEEAREAGPAGAKGVIDLIKNPFCKVEADSENLTRFRLSPPADQMVWLGGTFSGLQDRVFEFDLGTYSEYTRDQWCDALRNHAQYAALRATSTRNFDDAVSAEDKRRAYWAEHSLAETIEDALEKLRELCPECPYQFLSGYFTAVSSRRESKSLTAQVEETKRWRATTQAGIANVKLARRKARSSINGHTLIEKPLVEFANNGHSELTTATYLTVEETPRSVKSENALGRTRSLPSKSLSARSAIQRTPSRTRQSIRETFVSVKTQVIEMVNSDSTGGSMRRALGSMMRNTRASHVATDLQQKEVNDDLPLQGASSSNASPRESFSQTSPEFKVLALDVDEACRVILESCGVVNIYRHMTEYELMDLIEEYDALICRSSLKVTEKLLNRATKLKIIALSQVASDNVPIEACVQRGIRVCNSVHGDTQATAEHTIGLMLAMARKINSADQSIREGHWKREPFVGSQLCETTLGLLGFGNVGFKVGKIASAIGMNIMVYDPFADEERSSDKATSIGATLLKNEDELSLLYQAARVLCVSVPLTARTRGMVGAAEIALMRPGSYIVNSARGGIVDEDALSEALKSGHLAGAALDVYESEQDFVTAGCVPNGYCLLTAPNTVLTPHIGAMSAEAQEAVAIDASLQVADFLARQVEPKFALTKPNEEDPTKLIDARPEWMSLSCAVYNMG